MPLSRVLRAAIPVKSALYRNSDWCRRCSTHQLCKRELSQSQCSLLLDRSQSRSPELGTAGLLVQGFAEM